MNRIIDSTTNYCESLAKSIVLLTDKQIIKCLKREIKNYDLIVKQYNSFEDFIKENISIVRCVNNPNWYIYYKDKFICCVEQEFDLAKKRFSVKISKRTIPLYNGLS